MQIGDLRKISFVQLSRTQLWKKLENAQFMIEKKFHFFILFRSFNNKLVIYTLCQKKLVDKKSLQFILP